MWSGPPAPPEEARTIYDVMAANQEPCAIGMMLMWQHYCLSRVLWLDFVLLVADDGVMFPVRVFLAVELRWRFGDFRVIVHITFNNYGIMLKYCLGLRKDFLRRKLFKFLVLVWALIFDSCVEIYVSVSLYY